MLPRMVGTILENGMPTNPRMSELAYRPELTELRSAILETTET